MKRIIRHTEYLLSRHDCVIIPGFGAVLARYESACADPEDGRILPPRRVFTFNSALQHTDGVLAASIARAEGIGYDAAAIEIAAGVERMQRQLLTAGRLSLGRVGEFVLAEGASAPEFAPAPTDTISVATAWLPQVSAAEEQHQEQAEAAKPAVKPYSPFARAVRWVASVAILLGICFVASTPIAIDNAALASLSPQIKQAPAEEFLPAEAEAIPSISIVASHSPEAVIDVEALQQQCRYFVVVASFASLADAERHIAAYPGLKYVQADGRYRIYAAAFPAEADAYAYINSSQYGSAGAWVCKL